MISADDPDRDFLDAELRDEQTREEFEDPGNLAPTLAEARDYLSAHDAEAQIGQPNEKIVFSPPYIAAAAELSDKDALEFQKLVKELKRRGYRVREFATKVREARKERKQEERHHSSRRRMSHTQPSPSQNGNGLHNGAVTLATNDRWKSILLDPTCPFIAKGFSSSVGGRRYLYVSKATNTLSAIAPSQHRPPGIFEIASADWWLDRYGQTTEKGSYIDWPAAQSDLFMAGGAAGVFDAAQARRGIGLYNDDGRLIFHKGNALIDEEGKLISLTAFKSKYIYEPRTALYLDMTDYASDTEAGYVEDALSKFRWSNRLSPKLLSGHLAITPLAGAVPFRPTGWLCAADQSGKTTILREIAVPVLGGDTGHFVLVPSGGQTSEAFLRQSMDCDCRGIIFDEADGVGGMTAILNYLRGSNSSGGIGKGSPSGDPMHYGGKPMALLASISLPISEAADKGRTLVFNLWRAPNTPEAAETYASLSKTISERFTPDFGRRFIARCLRFSKTTLGNIAAYRRALIKLRHDTRTADRLAAVLAGSRSLSPAAGIALTDIETEKELAGMVFGDFASSDSAEYAAQRDERSFWDHVISQRVRVGNLDFTIGELIDDLRRTPLQNGTDRHQALLRHGIRFSDDGMDLLIARGKDAFKVLLSETKWANNYYLHLNRLLEAANLDPNIYTTQVRFGGLGRAYATILPRKVINDLLGSIDDDEEVSEAEEVRRILRECIDSKLKLKVNESENCIEITGNPSKRLHADIEKYAKPIMTILREYEARN
jgi:hypothetical protein